MLNKARSKGYLPPPTCFGVNAAAGLRFAFSYGGRCDLRHLAWYSADASSKDTPAAVSGTSKQEIPGYNGAMHADTKKPAQPRRRWFRFSLRTLFILVTVLSVPLGWVGWELNQVRKERHAIAWVEEMGGEVSLHSRYRASERSWREKTTEKWFGKRIRSVSLVKTQVSDLLLLTVLIYLSNLEWTIEEISEEDETHQWAIIRTRNEPLERDYKYFVDF